jgi:osmotically-inducible protein OsmY
VIGVESVEAENLHIRWWERDTLTPSVGKLSDAQIESAVNRALESDPRVMAQNPRIKVNGGVVTLSGPVRSLSAKVAVEETALNTVGVRKVVNLTKVRPDEPVPKDSLLKLMVTNALKRDPYVESPDVDVDVMDGVVYLHGRVDSGFEKIRAQELASNTRGVLKVDNNLAFESGWDFKDDLELREDVEYQLFWSPFVDSDKIDVEVDHGSVILRGRVSSWQAYRSARSNALDAGAKDVRNQLIVEDQTVGTWF